MSIYEDLLKDTKSLRTASEVDPCGMDDFFSADRIKVASLGDLTDFFRVSSDTLIHKAEKDLWRIGENKTGDVIIERLFNPDNKQPLKV